MKKWQNASYLIDAKKCIDSLLYISLNVNKLANINLKEKVNNIRKKFYINLCYILDEKYAKDKKEICKLNKFINRIYYERDKNVAHKDSNYKPRKYNSFEIEIEDKKKEIEEVKILCKEMLPSRVTLDYVPHDKELFRLINRLNADMEMDANKIKYPRGVFHSYQLSEEGTHFFRDFDTEEEDRRAAKLLGYDYDEVISRRLVECADDISQMSKEEKSRAAVLIENGINSYEGLQNRQDSCIKFNLLYGENIWAQPNYHNFKKIEELKEIGFLDEFELPHWKVLENEEIKKKYEKITENINVKN